MEQDGATQDRPTSVANSGHQQKRSNKIAGIDFGTSELRCAIMEAGEPKIVPCGTNGAIPSAVSFDDNDKIITGQSAASRALAAPNQTAEDLIRHLGSDGIELGGETYVPEGLAAVLLQELKQDLDVYMGAPVERAVITVPTSFSQRQRQAVKAAGELAGFKIERIMMAPVVAALSPKIDLDLDRNILVCDLGAGTFDVALLRLYGGAYEILATNGDNDLGGNDWDQAVVDWLNTEFEREHGVDLSSDPSAQRRILEAVRDARTDLLSRTQTNVFVPNVAMIEGETLDLQHSLTEEQFRSATGHLLERLDGPVEQALADAHYSKSDVDELVLVGGFTRTPVIREKFEELLGLAPTEPPTRAENTALGAAMQGGVLSGEVNDIVVLDVTPLSMGVEVKGGLFEPLIKNNTTIPTEESKVFTTTEPEQSEAMIRVLQGDSTLARENTLLGECLLTDLDSTDEKPSRITIRLSMDENSIFAVDAEEGSITLDEDGESELRPTDDGASAEMAVGPERGISDEVFAEIRSSLTEDSIPAEALRGSDQRRHIPGASDKHSEAQIALYFPLLAEDITEEQIEFLLDLRDDLRRARETETEEVSAIHDGLETVDRKLQGFIESLPSDIPDDSSESLIEEHLDELHQRIESLLQEGSASATAVREQVSLIAKQVGAILWGCDIDIIDPAPGEPTDANRHNVIGTESGQTKEGRILTVTRSGYQQNGVVQRPASVVVSSGRDENPPSEIPAAPAVDVEYEELEPGEVIGQGGNADVYRATIPTKGTNHPLAIKKPRITGTLHQEVIERFVHKAETWTKLATHDHIVDVVDWGTAPGPWIAMEYMDGGSLDEYAGSLPPQQALWTALSITQAVYHAHRRGIAHCDLKPENILFRETESSWNVSKVGDWGLSTHLLDHSQSADGFSPQYAAPEQYPNNEGTVDEATDIYQLGAVLYELFTGQPPFTREPGKGMRQSVRDEPRAPSDVADVPEGIDGILLTALATEKEDRYGDILYLRDAIEELYDQW